MHVSPSLPSPPAPFCVKRHFSVSHVSKVNSGGENSMAPYYLFDKLPRIQFLHFYHQVPVTEKNGIHS